MSERDFPHASLVEGLRFTAQVAVPNVVQGLFRRRRTLTGAAGAINVEGFASGFMAGLRRSYGDGPLWIRVAANEALLLLGRDAARHALEQAPDPFAADPEPKRSAMRHFQPEALTISRGEEWRRRREFAEAVLDTGRPAHRLHERFETIAAEEASALRGELDWTTFNEAVRRATRRIVLGERAADDAELHRMLGELMDKSNPPGGGDEELRARFDERLAGHVDAAEAGSLAGLFADAEPEDGPPVDPAGQIIHWLFAMGDTLAMNVFRALALLAAFTPEGERAREDRAYSEACLQEAMRLWPTTAMLSRETVRDVEWDGVTVPEGTQLLIVNSFNHRDGDEVLGADAFGPERWLTGDAAEDWQFNHFSHGPQGCPGAALALLVGREMLTTILAGSTVEARSGELDPARPLPHALDFFGLRFALTPRD